MVQELKLDGYSDILLALENMNLYIYCSNF